MWLQVLASSALGWYAAVLIVSAVGTVRLYQNYSCRTPKPVSPFLHPLERVPHVTIIRPIKGLEPYLYECLASTFCQSYPASKLTVHFCISSKDDPAFPVARRVADDFSDFDVRIYIEEDDVDASGKKVNGHVGERNGTSWQNLGPNPKIRNMSRAYQEAKGDIIWIADCNVWLSKSVAGLMVDLLCGFSSSSSPTKPKHKFVHQLPLVVDVSGLKSRDGLRGGLSRAASSGSLLDELFLSTAHAKFYTAISTAAVAPCTCGKSNMFRRSHLAALTSSMPDFSPGIDFFSHNICEDHLIGDLLWKNPVTRSVLDVAASEGRGTSESNNDPSLPSQWPDTSKPRQLWENHALLIAPPCIQPMADTPLRSYAARRARWLRVRKFTVPVATLVEPGTESLLASAIGAFGLSTSTLSPLPHTWPTFTLVLVCSMISWLVVDHWVWIMLQRWSGEGSEGDQGNSKETATGSKPREISQIQAPDFVGSGLKRRGAYWLASWAGRELLAFPIWAWAIFGGTEVIWRDRRFRVGIDMRVHEIDPEGAIHKKVKRT